MIRGFYTALSGMIAARVRQEVVADSIANVNTTGYKAQHLDEADFGMELSSSFGSRLGWLGTGTYPTNLTVDRSTGSIQDTNVPTDLAIEGDGLFAVRVNGGTAYIRGGDFHLDGSGMLVTQQGYAVLDRNGRPVRVAGALEVGADGTVTGTNQRIAIATFPADGLRRLGDGLYASDAPLPAAAAGSYVLRQGALESSNVDLAGAMTDLVALQRQFSLDARAMSLQEDTLTELSQLGRIR